MVVLKKYGGFAKKDMSGNQELIEELKAVPIVLIVKED